jgi:hypothetical protein
LTPAYLLLEVTNKSYKFCRYGLDYGYTLATRRGSMKDAGMRIRVEQELRDAFVAACQKMDVPAAQVLRKHMRVIVDEVAQTTANKQKKVAKVKSK